MSLETRVNSGPSILADREARDVLITQRILPFRTAHRRRPAPIVGRSDPRHCCSSQIPLLPGSFRICVPQQCPDPWRPTPIVGRLIRKGLTARIFRVAEISPTAGTARIQGATESVGLQGSEEPLLAADRGRRGRARWSPVGQIIP